MQPFYRMSLLGFLTANFISFCAVHRFIVQEVIFAHKQKEGVEIVNVRERDA
jgi:hypothetical protein